MSEHLDPAVLVDLFEGVPVDAAHRQHLSQCLVCRKELDKLFAAGRLVSELSDGDALDAATFDPVEDDVRWARVSRLVSSSVGFDVDLNPDRANLSETAPEEAVEVTESRLGARSYLRWLPLAAAALLLWFSGSVLRTTTGVDRASEPPREVTLLPPADQDEEFLFLVGVSETLVSGIGQGQLVLESWFGSTTGEWSTGQATMQLLELEESERNALLAALAADETPFGEEVFFDEALEPGEL